MRKSVQKDEVDRAHQNSRRIEGLSRQFAAEVEASADVTDFLASFEDQTAEATHRIVTQTPNTLSAHRRA